MITRHQIRNAMLDAFERVCENTQEYYRLNQAPEAKLYELENKLVVWLRSIGIEV